MGASAFLKSVDFTVFTVNVKTIAPMQNLYQFGHAIYWGTMPMAVFTFLEHFDFSGKTIKPFCTHEGSGLGGSEKDIQRLCPGGKVEKGLATHGGGVAAAGPAIKKWIEK